MFTPVRLKLKKHHMKKIVGLLIILIVVACGQKKHSGTHFESADRSNFVFELGNEAMPRELLTDSILTCSGCTIGLANIAGKNAIELRTSEEFSDGFIDLKKLFGHTIDFRSARYLELALYVPKTSWITALKFNYQDEKGNFGGCHEIANNFYGNYDKWIKVRVDLKEALTDCKNWVGEESPIPNTAVLSLNPYNTHQADSSSIYINTIKVGTNKPDGDFLEALSAKADTISTPFEMDFEDGAYFRKVLAYRGFESSGQALEKGKFGNNTMAVRIQNSNDVQRKYTCFLPMFEKVTGSTVDFSKVKKIYFDYYLTESSDDFQDATLFLTGEHWNQILKDTSALSNFKKGSWERAEIYMDSLNLDLVKGDFNPIEAVYELRIDLNYLPGHKNTEMWIDNFGWE